MWYKYQCCSNGVTWEVKFSSPFQWSKNPGDKKEYGDFYITFVGTETQEEE